MDKQTLRIRERIHAPDDPELARGLNGLALALYETGRYAEAEPLYARALAILDKALPPDHPHRTRVRENYARLLDKLGRHAEAAALPAGAGAADQGSRP